MRAFILGICVVLASGLERLDGHKVLRVVPQTLEELEWVRSLEYLVTDPNEMNWWQDPLKPGLPVDVRVSLAFYQQALNHFYLKDLTPIVQIEDAQTYLDEARAPGDGTWDTEYHPYDASGGVVDWLHDAAKAYPSFVSVISMGKTYENRTIYGLKISTDTTGKTPVIFLDGGIHAREWIAAAVVQYVIGQFVNHSTDARIAPYLANFTWYIFPVWNADGYNYTWTTRPEWRKNRQPNPGSTCIGTDCNRNCDAGWGGPGASADPCSDTYRGDAPWSSIEAAVWRDYLTSLVSEHKVVAYVDFHASGSMWLDPYGYTDRLPADYDIQQANSKNITDAIASVNNATYRYGPIWTTIYPASGSTADWVYDSLKVVFSSATEVRGPGFQPAPTQIIPNGAELFAGVLKLADDAYAHFHAL